MNLLDFCVFENGFGVDAAEVLETALGDLLRRHLLMPILIYNLIRIIQLPKRSVQRVRWRHRRGVDVVHPDVAATFLRIRDERLASLIVLLAVEEHVECFLQLLVVLDIDSIL